MPLLSPLIGLLCTLASFGTSGLLERLDGGVMTSLACSPARCVLVGQDGVLETREADSSWVIRDLPTDETLVHVAWADSEFVAFGRWGAVFGSRDGVDWSLRSTIPILRSTFSVLVGPRLWLVFATDSVWRSADRGHTWAYDSLRGADGSLEGAWTPWGPVLHSGGTGIQSPEGLSWTVDSEMGNEMSGRGVACNDSLCLQLLIPRLTMFHPPVLVRRRLGEAAWDTIPAPKDLPAASWIFADKLGFVILQKGVSRFSRDGDSWTKDSSAHLVGLDTRMLARFGAMLLLATRNGSILVSDSLRSWRRERERHSLDSRGLALTSLGIVRLGHTIDNSIAEPFTTWASVTDDQGKTRWSTYESMSHRNVRAFAADGDTLLAGTETGVLLRSVGGLHWDSIGQAFPVAGLDHGPRGWLLAASADSVARSTDGWNWAVSHVPARPNTTRSWVRSRDSGWIMGGGVVWESADGESWTLADSSSLLNTWANNTSKGFVISSIDRRQALVRWPSGKWSPDWSFPGGSAVVVDPQGRFVGFGPDSIVRQGTPLPVRLGNFRQARAFLQVGDRYWIAGQGGLLLRSRDGASGSGPRSRQRQDGLHLWTARTFLSPTSGSLRLLDASGRVVSERIVRSGESVHVERSRGVLIWSWRPDRGSPVSGRLGPL